MERGLMGREKVESPVAIEVPADEPTSDKRRHHGLTHLAVSPLVQHLCPMLQWSKS